MLEYHRAPFTADLQLRRHPLNDTALEALQTKRRSYFPIINSSYFAKSVRAKGEEGDWSKEENADDGRVEDGRLDEGKAMSRWVDSGRAPTQIIRQTKVVEWRINQVRETANIWG